MIFLQVFLGAMLAHVVYRVGVKTFNSIAFWYLTRSMGKAQIGKVYQGTELPIGGLAPLEMCKCSCGASHPKMHACSTCGQKHVDWKMGAARQSADTKSCC